MSYQLTFCLSKFIDLNLCDSYLMFYFFAKVIKLKLLHTLLVIEDALPKSSNTFAPSRAPVI